MHFLLIWITTLVLLMSAPFTRIDNKVKPYYDEFMSIVKTECPNLETPKQLTITFKTLKNEEIGLCTFYAFRRDVNFDPLYWATSTNAIQRQLVFHELTHCILNVHHIEDSNNYMNSYIVYVPENVLLQQLKDNIKTVCN